MYPIEIIVILISCKKEEDLHNKTKYWKKNKFEKNCFDKIFLTEYYFSI